INHGIVVAGRSVPHEVPGGVDESIHGVGFATGRLATFGAGARQECFVLVKRIATAIGNQLFGQSDWQVFFGYGNRTAVCAMDDGNGGTPVTLTGNAPVTQAPGGLLFAQTLAGKYFGNGIDSLLVVKAVELA